MATIKAIEGRSVHQIQSGQVIVDLCSVVKELVENSLDADARSIEVRLKNSGLDAIEIQDNGIGIAETNYENIALKHYTSKLSAYDDLESLRTFGFRGEALSSLCALSTVDIVTAQANEAPKGARLEFEMSGKLKGRKVVAAQKGTVVSVAGLFQNLPVRRRELEKNIKREYGKVLSMLHAYACISTGVRFVVSNQTVQGKKAVAFSTNANRTTKENIANVFGAKTMAALVPLDLSFKLRPSASGARIRLGDDDAMRKFHIVGHISRPVFGEGRSTPDRQMFFVNSRPCGLPQVAKAFNEVYKSYNMSQSPFIFADLRMDTSSYDVNVSPDKRTIFLQDQTALLEALKTSLIELFETQDQTMPHTQLPPRGLPAFKQLTLRREGTATSSASSTSMTSSDDVPEILPASSNPVHELPHAFPDIEPTNTLPGSDVAYDRVSHTCGPPDLTDNKYQHHIRDREVSAVARDDSLGRTVRSPDLPDPVQDFNQRIAEQELRMPSHKPVPRENLQQTHSCPESKLEEQDESPIATLVHENRPRLGQSKLKTSEHTRFRRSQQETATITIGSTTTTSPVRIPARWRETHEGRRNQQPISRSTRNRKNTFGRGLRAFAAPGTQAMQDLQEDDDEEQGDIDSDSSMVEKEREEQFSETQSSPRPSPLSAQDTNYENIETHPDDTSVSDDEPSNLTSDHQRTPSEHDDSDEEYLDEAAGKTVQESRAQQLIHDAERHAERPTESNIERTKSLNGDGPTNSPILSTQGLILHMEISLSKIEEQCNRLNAQMQAYEEQSAGTPHGPSAPEGASAEETLSLIVTKDDFSRMRVVGQFNLGFILATRPSIDCASLSSVASDVFIIDQHASDEKYNFERLQRTTILNHQRLVRALPLSLTAIEEEIILEHLDTTLAKNGFLITIDNSGAEPVGQRCKLVALPTSREAVFSEKDLEELLAMLTDSPTAHGDGAEVLRPSKARKLLAMRACRRSIMIGRSLTKGQMTGVVRRLGGMDKPWNCPHGRPTMRHVIGLNSWEGWNGDQD